MSTNFSLNLETISTQAFKGILKIDQGFVGSSDYMGIAFFWNYDYRHFLRDATVSKRKSVHSKFIKSGLNVSESSEAHEKIVFAVCG